MAGPTTFVFGIGELTEVRLADIDGLLASIASTVTRTRKGRVWELQVRNRPIHVAIELTSDVLCECEDDLLAANLLPEDAPFRVLLSAGANEPVDYEVLRDLTSKLSPMLGGPAGEPTK